MSHARLSPYFFTKVSLKWFLTPLIKIWSTLFGSPSSISSNTLSVTTSPFSPMKKTIRRDDGDISGRILNRKLDITPTLWTLTHWRSILPRVITWWKKNCLKWDRGGRVTWKSNCNTLSWRETSAMLAYCDASLYNLSTKIFMSSLWNYFQM